MYRALFTPTAESDLAALDKTVAQRVLNKIHWLAENVDTLRPVPLTGQWSGIYKLRVGDYRVLYTAEADNKLLTVHFARHRRDVYRS